MGITFGGGLPWILRGYFNGLLMLLIHSQSVPCLPDKVGHAGTLAYS